MNSEAWKFVGGFAVVGFCVLFLITVFRRLSLRRELGEELFRVPSAYPKWTGFGFVGYAVLRCLDTLWDLVKGRMPGEIVDIAGGPFVLFIAFAWLGVCSGLRIHKGGIDLSFVALPWSSIQGWRWDREAADYLEFATDSPWRFLWSLSPRRRVRYKTVFDRDLDARLSVLTPKIAVADGTPGLNGSSI